MVSAPPPAVNETLISIDAPHFNAGIVARDGRVVAAAPILNYMLGWDGAKVADYCRGKGWAWIKVTPDTAPPSAADT